MPTISPTFENSQKITHAKKLSIRPKNVFSPSESRDDSSTISPRSNQKQHHLQVKIPKLKAGDLQPQEVDLGFTNLRLPNNLAAKKRYSSIYSRAEGSGAPESPSHDTMKGSHLSPNSLKNRISKNDDFALQPLSSKKRGVKQ